LSTFLGCWWITSLLLGLLRVRIVPPITVVAEFHDYIFSGGNSAPKATAPLFRNRFVSPPLRSSGLSAFPSAHLAGKGDGCLLRLGSHPGTLGIAPLGPCLAAIHQPGYLGVASWCLLPGLRFGSHNTSVDSASKSLAAEGAGSRLSIRYTGSSSLKSGT